MTRIACSIVLFIGAAAPLEAFAQQSLFNVPSTQETVVGKLFGQVQIGAGETGGEVNTTLELGIFPWLEVGANLQHVPIYRLQGFPATGSPTAAFNANVYFEPTSFMAIECGVQAGVGWRQPASVLTPVVFGWATMRFDAPGRFGSYVVGLYSGTSGALGGGFPLGGMVGVEIPLWQGYIHAQADWMIGLNDVSVAVIGAVAYIGKSFQLSAGAQLPSPGTGNDYGGVLELTYTPTHDPVDPPSSTPVR
ncbi:MAG: hypothetical protein IT381_27295 [Deltaproteobacteria bacterium]|nr:hypothetical protein [Deltaproteobacteria bacterium]